MDERKNCIIILDKRLNCFVDKTRDIYQIVKNEANATYEVTFHGGYSYTYYSVNVLWLTDPKNLSISDKIVYSANKRLTNIKEILDFGKWIKIVFLNGSITSYPREKVKMIRNCVNDGNAKNLLEYLKEISAVIDETLDEKKGFINNELDKIEISEESFLAWFLKNNPPIRKAVQGTLIFPFSANQSQIQAVKNALSYNISAIQGPPGTGKTQTILNILANLLIRNKKVAVVSGNNEATRNVQEKLAKVNLDEVGAFLGKTKNVELFFESRHSLKQFQEKSELYVSQETVFELVQKAEQIYKYRIQRAETNKAIREYIAEKQKYDLFFNNIKLDIPKELKQRLLIANKHLELAAYLEILLYKRKVGIIDKLKLRFIYKLRKLKLVLNHTEECIDYLQHSFYENKLKELHETKEQISKFLNSDVNKNVIADLEQYSMRYLKNYLTHYYKSVSKTEFLLENYKYNFSEFQKRYPVIFSTTHALRLCSGKDLYDYVIVDESSQVDLASAVIAMSLAKNIVFVGDIKQLPHIVKSADKQPLQDVFQKYKLPEYCEYIKNNILKSITTKYGQGLPNVLLNEHYRCDPQIIDFCNKRFYNGELKIQTEHQADGGLKIVEAASHSALGRKNELQAEIIRKDLLPVIGEESVGIVAPYRVQVELLSKMVQGSEVFVETVHKFQGKERKTMILSTVSDKVTFFEDEEKVDFLNNENLINVALSRAEEKLFVIASREMLSQEGTIINELARYASYYCGADSLQTSDIYSIFELMYDDYAPILSSLKQKLLHISEYQSENIVATVLQDICQSNQFGNIKFKFNYPLCNLIRSEALDDIEDRRFVFNKNTHCDFVIYNVMDKTVKLVIEVDGKTHCNEVQQQRDARKDKLLTAVNIPILRLKTTDFDCEKKIKEALMLKC